MEFINTQFLENSLESWLTALGVSLIAFLVFWLVKQLIKNRLLKIIKKTPTDLDNFLVPLVKKTHWFSMLALGFYIGSGFLELPPEVSSWFSKAIQLVLILQIGFWGTGLISYYVTRKVESKVADDQGEDATTLDALGLIGKIVLWVILSLILLDNIGIEVSTLVTSLGIGGIAVALALQNILGDLFASMSIAIDKPFVIGDFVVVDSFEGHVEDIGLKSTRIRSLSGEEMIFSNTDLLKSRIRNFKRMEKRRISFSFGVVYGTDLALLKKIPQIVEDIITPIERASFERVHFKSLGDYSLNYSVVYNVHAPEYASYLDVQQIINLALYEKFEKLGLEFAFPTQTVLIEQ